MMNGCVTPRERLCDAIRRIVEASVTSGPRLRNMPELCEPLLQAIRQWYEEEACHCSSVARFSDEIGIRPELMAEDFVRFVSGSGFNGAYPTLSGLLTIAHCVGEEEAVRFLLAAANDHAAGHARQSRTDRARARAVRALSGGEEAVGAEEALAALGSSDKEFLGDLVLLAWVLKLPDKMVMDYLLRGEQVALVKGIREDLRDLLRRDVREAMRPLVERARAYELPELFRVSRKSLKTTLRMEQERIPLILLMY